MKIGIIGCGEIGEQVESDACGGFDEFGQEIGFGSNDVVVRGYIDENGICPFDLIAIALDASDLGACRKAMRTSLAVNEANVRSVLHVWEDCRNEIGVLQEVLDSAFRLIPSEIVCVSPDEVRILTGAEKAEALTRLTLKTITEAFLIDSLCDETIPDEMFTASFGGGRNQRV